MRSSERVTWAGSGRFRPPIDNVGVYRSRPARGPASTWRSAQSIARGVGGAPSASPSNLYLTPGIRNREELLAAFPQAVLIIELIGHGVNPVTGDYSRGGVGFMVRGGVIAEPVAEITIASNLIDMFATLEPASDLELRRGIDAPTVLIPEMTIGAA